MEFRCWALCRFLHLVFQMEKACHGSIAVKRPQDVGTPTQIPEEPETLARRSFPNEDAIGKMITIKTPDYGPDEVGSREPREIIGILPDIHETKLTDPAPAAFYVPYLQTAVRRM